MSLSNQGSLANKNKPSVIGRAKSLNPNAAEFVPFALRPPSGKSVLDRSESSISNNSDEEARQFWHHQLPDDITPDFKVMGEEDSLGTKSNPFSSLSLIDINENSRFPGSSGSNSILKEHQKVSHHRIDGNGFSEKMRFSALPFGENQSSGNFHHFHAKPWDKESVHDDQFLAGVRGGPTYNGNSGHGYMNEMLNEQHMVEGTDVNPLEFLASQFPGCAAESLAEIFFANGGDMNLTIEMLTQLELQIDGGINQNLNSKAMSAPNLNAMDFPALSVVDGQNGMPRFLPGDDTQQNINPYRPEKENLLMFKSSSSLPTRGASDFASAVRKMASQDSSIWKYERNGSPEASVGSSRSSHVLASSNNGGQGRVMYGGDRLPNRDSTRTAPVWFETGEAVANMYTEMRGEARDHARLRNAYFEQARQAFLIGNKALAKELSVKGQLHNIQMKAAHEKAQESIYRQRNPASPEIYGNGRGHEKIINLHGLYVSEAIHVLKRDLAILRSAARSAEQHMQVYICVGMGHHTRGARTPARLPIAVQHYLLEEEGLDYSETQPGLLRVVIY